MGNFFSLGSRVCIGIHYPAVLAPHRLSLSLVMYPPLAVTPQVSTNLGPVTRLELDVTFVIKAHSVTNFLWYYSRFYSIAPRIVPLIVPKPLQKTWFFVEVLALSEVLLYVWPQFTTPKLRANSPRLLVGQPTYFMVARTSLSSELVLPVIKKFMAPLEVGPEFALN